MNVIETSGLGKRYGRTWALKDAKLAIPGGYVVAPGRPERRGQDHAAAHVGRPDEADGRPDHRAGR